MNENIGSLFTLGQTNNKLSFISSNFLIQYSAIFFSCSSITFIQLFISPFHRDLTYSSAYSNETAHTISGVQGSNFQDHFFNSKSLVETSLIVHHQTLNGCNCFNESRFNINPHIQVNAIILWAVNTSASHQIS
jgi:hypothetical protein